MMNYWGFDLGDGESTLARVGSEGLTSPEIVDVDGKKVIITVWAVMRNGEVRIGENAARSAAAAVRSAARFKRRFLDPQSDSAALIRDFSARVFESLRDSGALVGGEKSNSVYVGCPAGWDAENRARYQRIFETIGFPTPHVVSESRAVMVGAIQSNSVRDYIDLRSKSVIVSDNGSVDGSAEMVRKEFPQVLLVENRANLGFGAANNRALDRAGGKYVFYLNSDTLLLNNALKIFFDYWESHPEENLGALGCNLTWPDGCFCLSSGTSRNGRFASAAAFRKNQRKLCLRSYKIALRHYVFRRPLRPVKDLDPPVEKIIGPVGYVTGADLFLLNDARARFDEGYFMYYEEVDLEYALSAAGKKLCLIDGPRIVHLEGASSVRGKYEVKDQTDFSRIQMSLSAIRFFRKHKLTGPLSLFFIKLYTAVLWLNPIVVRDTGRYVRRLIRL